MNPHVLAVTISESCILSIQFYAGSKFCVISTIPPPNVKRIFCKKINVSGNLYSVEFYGLKLIRSFS